MKCKITQFLIISVILLFILVLTGILLSRSLSEEVDHTYKWEGFYRDTVVNYFVFPDAIEIKKAHLHLSAFMGSSFTVVFYPKMDIAPKDLIERIATDSKIPAEYKIHELRYDCLEHCDLYQLYYDEKTKLFVAQAGWD